eukprot:4472933-Amphidinium_carterae.3
MSLALAMGNASNRRSVRCVHPNRTVRSPQRRNFVISTTTCSREATLCREQSHGQRWFLLGSDAVTPRMAANLSKCHAT